MRAILTTFIAVISITLLGTAVASADFPGRNGRVTFMRDDEHHVRQIWVATADLRHQTQLSAEDADSGFPVWAPNGSRIAFDTARADPDPADDTAINDVFTMRADGSDVRNLTHAVGFSADPAYSPDGRTIVFDTDLGDPANKQGIYLMSAADGSHLRRVTSLPQGYESDQAPRFSPDGEWIEFTRYRLQDRGPDQPPLEQSALFLVRPNGSGLRQMTSFDLLVGDGDWSPDGRRIVFETNGDVPSGVLPDIYVLNAQGRNLTNITQNTLGPDGTLNLSSDPVWSPDGRLILFLDGHDAPGSIKEGLATMRPDGSDRHFVSPMPQFEHQPDWESISRDHQETPRPQ
ncbi:MAG: hypothetical protein QOJ63_1483 [Solirubrobacteraceae bacterium]|nr:hypothetical protein [Solirubrobacteraceae bacterium]